MLKLKVEYIFRLWLIMGCVTVQKVVSTKGMPIELLKMGTRVNTALEKRIHYMDLQILTMERSLMRILAESTYNTTKEDYISTPVSALTTVRRLAKDWTALAGMMRGLTSESLTSRVGNVRWPTGEDLEITTRAVTRGQLVYNLGTDLLAQGSVDNITFFADMTALDSFNIAKDYIRKHHYPKAVEWLQHSLRRISGSDNSPSELSVLQYLAPALCHTGMSERCKQLMLYIVRKYPRSTTPQDLIVPYYDIFYKDTKALIDTANYMKTINNFGEKEEDELVETHNRLCRGETEIDTKLRCRYVHYGKPHLRFQPFKLEELHWDPPVLRFYDAITDLEAEMLRKAARKRMRPALVLTSAGEMETSDYRTSFVSWIKLEDSEAAYRLVPRMSDMTQLDVNLAEQHQVSSYALTGGYRPHMDFLGTPFLKDRLATLMYYLTDVKRGGNTVFLNWDLSIPPVKNSALLWFNYRPDGARQGDSMHSGCPVLQGRKWVLNKWISNLACPPCVDNYTNSYKNYYIE